jgi:hypothetical protein
VVDTKETAPEAFTGAAVEYVSEDGVEFVTERLAEKDRPDWIIPAVPIHLAFEWVRIQAAATGGEWEVLPVPQGVEPLVPNPIRGSHGQLYMSFADFVCPDYCAEPYERCTFTGKPRKGILCQLLGSLSFPGFTSVVLQSRQLAPGVGGYGPDHLEAGLRSVLDAAGPVLFSTACYCHGVMDALRPL